MLTGLWLDVHWLKSAFINQCRHDVARWRGANFDPEDQHRYNHGLCNFNWFLINCLLRLQRPIIAASSASIETAFNVAGFNCTDRRNRLEDCIFESLVLEKVQQGPTVVYVGDDDLWQIFFLFFKVDITPCFHPLLCGKVSLLLSRCLPMIRIN